MAQHLTTEKTFSCAACGEDYRHASAVPECRICHRSFCEECINSEGICVSCDTAQLGPQSAKKVKPMGQMKKQHERIASVIKDWRVLDKRSAESIGEIKARCKNPLVCLLMEIMEHDSRMHEKLQDFIVGSLEQHPIELSPDEIGEMVELMRHHTQIKTQMVEKTEEVLSLLTDKSLKIQEFLSRVLLADEKKHKEMLDGIEKVKSSLYPYWSH